MCALKQRSGVSDGASGGQYAEVSDERLVDVLRGGGDLDSAARELHRRYHTSVRALCRRNLSDNSLVDDATQETFIRAIHGIGTYKPNPEVGDNFRRWLFTIAINTSRTLGRERSNPVSSFTEEGVNPFSLPDPMSDSHAVVERELADRLKAGVGELPEKQRKVVEGRLDGEEYREIAGELNIPLGTVQSRLHKAKRNLRKKARGGVIDGFQHLPKPREHLSEP